MEDTETKPVEEQQEKVLTQADIDSAVKSRLAREQAKYDTEIAEVTQAKTDLELQLQKVQAKNMTESERIEAQDKRIDQLVQTLSERDEAEAQAKLNEVVRAVDSSDEKALLEAGFNPKYSEVALNALKASRGIENGQPFYKDKDGAAIDRMAVIETLVAQYPELVQINRVQGNSVPTGRGQGAVDPSKETAEQFIARMQRERAQ